MRITEIRFKLMDEAEGNERLRAFCSVTFDDCLVVRDIKVIESAKGLFIAMPSRKLMDRCPGCSNKNHLRSRFCNQCGQELAENRMVGRDSEGRIKYHADIAHPINREFRSEIQEVIIRAYSQEFKRSLLPGYVSKFYDPWDACTVCTDLLPRAE